MNRTLRTFSLVTAAATWILACGQATAAPILSTGFNASAGGVVTGSPVTTRTTFEAQFDAGTIKRESFSEVATGDVTSTGLGSLFPFSTGAGSLLVSSGQGSVADPDTSPGSGRFDTTCATPIPSTPDGCTRQWFETDGVFNISFGGNFSGFGFYATDWGDFLGSLSISLLKDGVVASTHEISFTDDGEANNGSLLFAGLFDSLNTYNGARITISQPVDTESPDFLGFDDLVIGLAPDGNGNGNGTIPEPPTLALALTSLLGLAAARRRRPR